MDANGAALGPASSPAPAPVAVTDIRVRRDRLVLTVALAGGTPRETTPELAKALVNAVSTLPEHACVNDCGPTFGAVLASTSLPHVLEHLIIDVQARASAPATPTFVGTTTWLDRSASIARVEVSYTDDLIALAAVKQALATLNGILKEASAQERNAATWPQRFFDTFGSLEDAAFEEPKGLDWSLDAHRSVDL